MGGRGGAGTIKSVSGTTTGTVTLTTSNGTETVVVSATTKIYGTQYQSMTLGSLAGDVGSAIQVRGSAPSSSGTAEQAPGTGTVDATAIRLVEPTVVGKLLSVNGSVYELIAPDGQRITVTVNGGTKYLSGVTNGVPTVSSSAPKLAAGAIVFASGPSETVTTTGTTITADLLGTRPAGPGPMGGPRGHGSPAGPGGR